MDIKKNVKNAQKLLGIEKLRKPQVKPINRILEGGDTMAIAPVAAGKSAIYQIPALIFEGMTLVIEPTLSLIYDQVQRLRRLGIKAAYLDSSMPKHERERALDQIRKQKIKLLLITPERLQNQSFQRAVASVKIDQLVIDECHCVTSWGHSFRLVIHFNMPLSLADYYQQSGRAGREGQKSKCVLLYCENDYYVNRVLLADIAHATARKGGLQALDRMKEYAESTGCLTQQLLNELGEQMDKPCGSCTNCQRRRKKK